MYGNFFLEEKKWKLSSGKRVSLKVQNQTKWIYNCFFSKILFLAKTLMSLLTWEAVLNVLFVLPNIQWVNYTYLLLRLLEHFLGQLNFGTISLPFFQKKSRERILIGRAVTRKKHHPDLQSVTHDIFVLKGKHYTMDIGARVVGKSSDVIDRRLKSNGAIIPWRNCEFINTELQHRCCIFS